MMQYWNKINKTKETVKMSNPYYVLTIICFSLAIIIGCAGIALSI